MILEIGVGVALAVGGYNLYKNASLRTKVVSGVENALALAQKDGGTAVTDVKAFVSAALAEIKKVL